MVPVRMQGFSLSSPTMTVLYPLFDASIWPREDPNHVTGKCGAQNVENIEDNTKRTCSATAM